jgi:uncharacterized caspase-like protein
MIDRRHVVLGGLAGLIAPAVAPAQQPRPGGGAPPASPASPVGNAGNAGGSIGSRLEQRTGGRRDDAAAGGQPGQAALPQPPRIKALILSQSYQATPAFALANTTRDAALIARAFQQLRFDQVSVHSDGAPAETMTRILAYLRTVDANTIALVYVAGHGLEIAGENLLLLEGGTIFLSLQAVIQMLQQRAGVTVLFLDACRNNPLAAAPRRGRVSRAVSLGAGEEVQLQTIDLDQLLASPADAPGRLRAFALQGSGVKIVFSTDPANVAFDGARPDSRNSPFAQALARHIREPVSLDDIVALTTGDVVRATHRVQSPWSQGSIDRPIYLSGERRRRQASYG